MSLLKSVLLPLLLAATIAPGWLGVFLGETEDGRPVVEETIANSPAEKAGIVKGDVILAIDGQEVTTIQALTKAVADRPAGAKITLKLRRAEAEKTVEVTLAERPADADQLRARGEAVRAEEGARAQREKARAEQERARAQRERAAGEQAEHSKAAARPYLGVALDVTDAGVQIGTVMPDSPAAKAGLGEGSLLVAVGDVEIRELADVDRAMGKLRAGEKVTIATRTEAGETRKVDVVLGRAPGEGEKPAPEKKKPEAGTGKEAARKEAEAGSKAPATDRPAAARQPRDSAPADALFRTDLRAALREARGKQPVLLVFGAAWDSGSKALRRSFEDESVRAALKGWPVVWVDTDREGRIADEYEVQQIPHMIALDAQGKRLGAIEGYQPPEMLVEKLRGLQGKAASPPAAQQGDAAPRAEARTEAKREARSKPEAPPKAAADRDLQAEIRALREEVKELRQLLRDLLKEREKAESKPKGEAERPRRE